MIARIFFFLCALTTSIASGSDMSPEATQRCIQSAVKIIAVGPTGGGSGTGTMIDPRGYILTNFHVVGHADASSGPPGTLVNPKNEVKIAIVSSARDIVRPTWVGKVVRADMRLDLALVRIMTDGEGKAVHGTPFKTIPIRSTDHLQPGHSLWAFGYPLGVRTINVTGGNLTGFEFNAEDQISWLRTDAEFNPGNSGGMLVDDTGSLIAIPTMVWRGGALEPVELARPTERIPKEWLSDLKRGHINDVKMNLSPKLVSGHIHYDRANGDGASMGSGEVLYYQLPPQQAGTATASEFIELALVKSGNKIARSAKGAVQRLPQDPRDLYLAAVVPPAQEKPWEFFVKFQADPNHSPSHTSAPTSPPVTESTLSPLNDAKTGTLEGLVVDAITGQPISMAMVMAAHPEVDLTQAIAQVRSGQIAGKAFDQLLISATRTNEKGWFRLEKLPLGYTYPIAVFEKSRRIIITTFNMPENATTPLSTGRFMMTP